MLVIQNGGNLAMDRWMRYEISHGNYFHKWFQSVDNWRWTVWNDNDPFLDDYIAHPMQGAVYELIYIQNDERGRYLPLENTGRYWKSRLRAVLWSTFWSTEWKIGPLSEAAIGNTGLGPYYSRESHGMTNGTGVVDFVMTPVGGFVWVLGEEALDKVLVSRLRRVSRNRVWTAALAILMPTHAGANILRWKKPWYRDVPPATVAAVRP